MKRWAVSTRFTPGQLAGGLQVADAGGEIEHGRHAAEGVQREEGDNDARTGRQHHAHPLARLGEAGDLASEREGGPDQVGVAQGVAVLVLEDGFLGPKSLACIHQRIEQRRLRLAGIKGTRQEPPPPKPLLLQPSLSPGSADEKNGYRA
jgi:hypothetical protein